MQTRLNHHHRVNSVMNFSSRHFPKDIILTAIRWYLRYKLSYRDIEELMAESGINVDHSTLNRWVVKYVPLLAAKAQHHKRKVGISWRLDETYIRVRGSNTAAIEAYNAERGSRIEIRQCKYLNNIVEQDHRRVKQKTRAALGFKAFYSAHATLQGVELIQMIRKGQVHPVPGRKLYRTIQPTGDVI